MTEALLDLHLSRGGRPGTVDGVATVAAFSDPASEWAALGAGRALVDRSFVARLELLGEDRQRFLHGLVTCDVTGLEPGALAYGFFTSLQGRVLADLTVLALPDRLRLELPAGQGELIRDHLTKYLIADRVEIREAADRVPLSVVGSSEREDASASLPFDRVVAEGGSPEVDRRLWWGLDTTTYWLPSSEAPDAWGRLVAEGAQPVGIEAVEAARVGAGVVRFGADFDAEHFPQETGTEAKGVSYTKGCYLGQEVVARIHYRGRVQRGPCRLRLEGEAALGSELRRDGRGVGRLTSVAGAAPGPRLGLGILHRRAWETDARLEVAGGGEAIVLAAPDPGPEAG